MGSKGRQWVIRHVGVAKAPRACRWDGRAAEDVRGSATGASTNMRKGVPHGLGCAMGTDLHGRVVAEVSHEEAHACDRAFLDFLVLVLRLQPSLDDLDAEQGRGLLQPGGIVGVVGRMGFSVGLKRGSDLEDERNVGLESERFGRRLGAEKPNDLAQNPKSLGDRLVVTVVGQRNNRRQEESNVRLEGGGRVRGECLQEQQTGRGMGWGPGGEGSVSTA